MEFFINNQVMNIVSFIIGIVGFFVAIVQIIKAGNVSNVVKAWGKHTIIKIENLSKELDDLYNKISKMDHQTEWRNKSNEIQSKVQAWANQTKEISNDLDVLFDFIKKAKKSGLIDKLK